MYKVWAIQLIFYNLLCMNAESRTTGEIKIQYPEFQNPDNYGQSESLHNAPDTAHGFTKS